MATQQKTITATADFVLTTETIDIDNVRIRAVSLISSTVGSAEASAFAEIGIMTGGTAQGNRIILLTSGYVGEMNPLTWHGDLVGSATERLYVNLRASSTDSFRLNLLSEPT